jgi:hypothetical protein
MKYTKNVSFKSQTVQWLAMDVWGIIVQFQVGASEFSLLQNIQTSYEAHPASSTMDTGGSLAGGKAAGACTWQLTLI